MFFPGGPRETTTVALPLGTDIQFLFLRYLLNHDRDAPCDLEK